MTLVRLGVTGCVFAGILITGLLTIFTGKAMHAPLAVAHKLLALLCLFFLLRSIGALRAFHAPPALPVALVVFAVAFLAAFATGIVQSVPSSAGLLWLNLHRVSAATAAVACAVAIRFIAAAHS